jgi:hypothetical protein
VARAGVGRRAPRRALGSAGHDERRSVPFLLVHGLASNARLWDGVAQHLAQRGHRVVAVDQRGHGRSSKPDDGYDMATVADDLRLLIDHSAGTAPPSPDSRGAATWCSSSPGRTPTSVSVIACVDGGFIDLAGRFPRVDRRRHGARSPTTDRHAAHRHHGDGSRPAPPTGPTGRTRGHARQLRGARRRHDRSVAHLRPPSHRCCAGCGNTSRRAATPRSRCRRC